MTFSHVIYLELARLIISWQWLTEVDSPLKSSAFQFCIKYGYDSPAESSFMLNMPDSPVQSSPVQSDFVLRMADSPVESSFVLSMSDSPV
jgi:hypothetical protein